MHLADALLHSCIRACAEADADVFFYADAPYTAAELRRLAEVDCGRTVVLLPGDFYLPDRANACCLRVDDADFDAAKTAPLFFADVRLLNREDFIGFLEAYPVRTVLLPFTECAFVSEYGYRASYRMLAELRAIGFSFCAVALFSAQGPNDNRLRELIGSRDAVLLKDHTPPVFPAVSFEARKERDLFLASACKKQANKKSIVLFPTRTEARDFCSFLRSRGVACGAVHGGLPHGANAEVVKEFFADRLQTVCATKNLLPSALFFQADNVLYAGLPFSPSHAERCAFLSVENKVTICFSKEDFARNEALSLDFADAVGADRTDFLAFRKEKQQALLASLMF
ncbi:MAG: hypothetical protein IJT27_06495 [Clostridia bacterium]|nr:hypothetical protein [Clostridia bacterium]